jgi:hypothetical protein
MIQSLTPVVFGKVAPIAGEAAAEKFEAVAAFRLERRCPVAMRSH